jgi:hypothetical protein
MKENATVVDGRIVPLILIVIFVAIKSQMIKKEKLKE